MPIDDYSSDAPDAPPNNASAPAPGKYIKISVPDFMNTGSPGGMSSYLRLGAVEDLTKAGKAAGAVGLVVDMEGNPLVADPNAPFNPSYDPYAPWGPTNTPADPSVTPPAPATTPTSALPPLPPNAAAYPSAAGPDPTGEDLASLVQGFIDDTRNRGRWTGTPGGQPKDPGTTAQGPQFGYPWTTPVTDAKAPGQLDAGDVSTTTTPKYTASSKPVFFPKDYRTLESSQLHTKGGWRDHSDGNRITTTRGDKVEVIRGNYKLLVLGRQDQTKPKYAGMDLSGGQADTGGGDLSADASTDFYPGSTTLANLFEWRQCITEAGTAKAAAEAPGNAQAAAQEAADAKAAADAADAKAAQLKTQADQAEQAAKAAQQAAAATEDATAVASANAKAAAAQQAAQKAAQAAAAAQAATTAANAAAAQSTAANAAAASAKKAASTAQATAMKAAAFAAANPGNAQAQAAATATAAAAATAQASAAKAQTAADNAAVDVGPTAAAAAAAQAKATAAQQAAQQAAEDAAAAATAAAATADQQTAQAALAAQAAAANAQAAANAAATQAAVADAKANEAAAAAEIASAGIDASALEQLKLWEDDDADPDYRSFSTSKKGSGPRVQVKYQKAQNDPSLIQQPDGTTFTRPISMGVSINETWSYQTYNYTGIGYSPATPPQPFPPPPPKTQTWSLDGKTPIDPPARVPPPPDFPTVPEWTIYPVAKVINKSYVWRQSSETFTHQTVTVTAGPRKHPLIADPSAPARTYPPDALDAKLYDRDLLKAVLLPGAGPGAYEKIPSTWAETHVMDQKTWLRADTTLSDTEVTVLQHTVLHATATLGQTTVGTQTTELDAGSTTSHTTVGTQTTTLDAGSTSSESHIGSKTDVSFIGTQNALSVVGLSDAINITGLSAKLGITGLDLSLTIAAMKVSVNIGMKLDVQIGDTWSANYGKKTDLTAAPKTEAQPQKTQATAGQHTHMAGSHNLT